MAVALPSVFAFHLNDLWPVLLPCAIGAAAVFLLLPRPQGNRRATLIGALLGGLALLIAAFLFVKTGVLSPETILFYIFAGLAIVSGGLLVTQHNPARAALSFALVVLSTCGLFLLLAAPFLMAATIIIYAGAIIVTFLFVLMLASQAGITDADARTREPLLATALGFLLLGCLIYVLQMTYETNETVPVIHAQLAKIERKKAKLSKDNLTELEHFPEELQVALRKVFTADNGQERSGAGVEELKTLDKSIRDIEWPTTNSADVQTMKDALTRLETLFLLALQQHGWLRPLAPDPALASDLSGPPAVGDAYAWRTDAEGRPNLPADNSAFLGRSLFTDFLLPVELGGVLLLVATVGAIAIAQRRTTTARAS